MKRWLATLMVLAAVTFAARARADEAPRTVWVGTYVNAIYGIDIKGSQFTIDFYVWWRWEGDDLKPYESFEIAGGKVTSKTPAGKRKIGNLNYYSLRVIANVTKFWDLRRYPLDHHTFVLEIEDAEHDTRTIHYEADRENVGYSPDLQVAGWALKSTRADVERHVYHTNYDDDAFAIGASFLTHQGFTNFSVIRSLSPIDRYFALSFSPFVKLGGSAQTPPW